MSVLIPHFDAKFQQIFGEGGPIRTYGELAAALNVTAPLITGWKNGTDYARPERIPRKHITNVCDALDVSQDLLELPDLAEFVVRLRNRPRQSLWDQMVAQAATTELLQILREDEVLADRTLLAPQRAIVVPHEPEPGLPVFDADENIIIRFESWRSGYIVLLLKDRSGWQCLHPNAYHLSTYTEGLFLFPVQTSANAPLFAKFAPPPGVQRLGAVFTPEPVPDKLVQALSESSDLPRTLLQLAAYLQAPKQKQSGAEILNYRFQVGV